jgi:hypothetical protein
MKIGDSHFSILFFQEDKQVFLPDLGSPGNFFDTLAIF